MIHSDINVILGPSKRGSSPLKLLKCKQVLKKYPITGPSGKGNVG
jgi:hypothetical protein